MVRGLYLAKVMFTYVSFTSQTLSFIAINQASVVLTFTSKLCLKLENTYVKSSGP